MAEHDSILRMIEEQPCEKVPYLMLRDWYVDQGNQAAVQHIEYYLEKIWPKMLAATDEALAAEERLDVRVWEKAMRRAVVSRMAWLEEPKELAVSFEFYLALMQDMERRWDDLGGDIQRPEPRRLTFRRIPLVTREGMKPVPAGNY